MKYGQALKEMVLASGVSQKEIADKLGVSPSSITQYFQSESDLNCPRTPMLYCQCMIHIGKQLDAIIKWSGIEYQEIAKKSGIPLTTLRRHLRSQNPPFMTAYWIISLTKYPPEELFPGYDRKAAEITKRIVSLSDEKRKVIEDLLRVL